MLTLQTRPYQLQMLMLTCLTWSAFWRLLNTPQILKVCSMVPVNSYDRGGLLFVSTLNRTAKSYVLAIAGAEHIMRMVPVGTHTWEKFLSPAEVGDLIISSEESKMEVVDICGMVLKPPFVDMRWTLDRNDTDVNWIGAYRKKNDEEEEHF